MRPSSSDRFVNVTTTEWLTVFVRFRPHPLVRFSILFPTVGIPLGILPTSSPGSGANRTPSNSYRTTTTGS
jgi:hypothetical protein